jgi:uncharacterized repeat protein (TIGR03803 family)
MRRISLAATLAAAVVLAGTAASAGTFTTLHTFCHHNDCNDGESPLVAPLIPDGRGNYLGTAQSGGVSGGGVLYTLVGGTTFKKLFDFPAAAGPIGSLIQDAQGNLFGIESFGNTGNGAVFRLHPLNANRTKWTYDVLYDFCPLSDSCPDGQSPLALTYDGAWSGVPYDGQSPLYGTTDFGGDKGFGTVFQLTDNGDTWSENVIYSICSKKGCPDGKYGSYALVNAPNGILYSTTAAGGSAKEGVVFMLTPNAHRTKWTQSVVYSFCALTNCSDGRSPTGLALDGQGGLYGSTSGGGDKGFGTLFQISAEGSFTSLYSFCQQAGCPDGAAPPVSPTLGPDGTLYGVTSLVLWSYAPQTSTYSVLHTFCTDDGKCKDGYEPTSPPTVAADGTVFGNTFSGGNTWDVGTVFSYLP